MSNNYSMHKLYTNWLVEQSVFMEWHDGPISGFCSLKNPGMEFYFDVIAVRENKNDLDDRLFRIYPVKTGTMKVLLEKLSIIGAPKEYTWIPVWKHEDKNQLTKLDEFIKRLISEATVSNLVLMTKDFESFDGCWEIKDSFETIEDWFTYLNTPECK